MWRSIWFWLALTAAVLGGAIAWGARTTTEVQVSTAPVTDGQITRRILATGTVQAVTTVEVGAQVSGVIASLDADYNSVVRAGQIVATLDASAYDAQLREAVAEREEADAGLKRADADVSRKPRRRRKPTSGLKFSPTRRCVTLPPSRSPL